MRRRNEVYMFQLALKSQWCDFKHILKSWKVVGVILFIVIMFIPVFSPALETNYLYLAWLFEFTICGFLPGYEKIYHVLPMSSADRKELLVYRQFILEAVLVLVCILAIIICSAIYGEIIVNPIYITSLVLMMYESFSAIAFCGFYKEAKLNEKGFGIFFSILIWVAYISGIFLGAGYNMSGVILVMIACFLQFIVKLYYMIHAHFEEYHQVDFFEGNVNQKKKAMSEEIF